MVMSRTANKATALPNIFQGVQETLDKENDISLQVQQKILTWKYAPGTTMYIYTTTSVYNKNPAFHKFTYIGKVGDNLYFEQITETGYKIKVSFQYNEFKYGIVKMFDSEEYKVYKENIKANQIIKGEQMK